MIDRFLNLHARASFIRKAMLFGSEPPRYQHAQNPSASNKVYKTATSR